MINIFSLILPPCSPNTLHKFHLERRKCRPTRNGLHLVLVQREISRAPKATMILEIFFFILAYVVRQTEKLVLVELLREIKEKTS